MIISERQIMQLIAIASDYSNIIDLMIQRGQASGSPEETSRNIRALLLEIRSQQSHDLREIK